MHGWRAAGLLLAAVAPDRPPELRVRVGEREVPAEVWWYHQPQGLVEPGALARFAGLSPVPAPKGAPVAWRLGEGAEVGRAALLGGWQGGLATANPLWDQELRPGREGRFHLPGAGGDLLLTFRFEWGGGRGGYVVRLQVP